MRKLLLKIGVVLIIAMIMCIGSVQAETSGHKFGINPERVDGSSKYVYTFQSPTNVKYIWNVQKYNNEIADQDETFYCLAEGYGNFGSSSTPATVGEVPVTVTSMNGAGISPSSYTGPYLLKEAKVVNSGVVTTLREAIYGGTEVKAFNEDRLAGLIGMLDNMYIAGEDNKMTFLSKIPCTSYGTITVPNDTYNLKTYIEMEESLGANILGTTAEISDADIEAVQQLAIWNITNHEDLANDQGIVSFPEMYIAKSGETLKTYSLTFPEYYDEDQGITNGRFREYCALMIYNYLVNEARTAQTVRYGMADGLPADDITTVLVYANRAAQPVVTITREQQLTGEYDVVIRKIDTEGKIVPGVVFTVNGVDYTVGTDGTVKVATNVQITEDNVGIPDIYTIVEKTAPERYSKYEGTITASIGKREAEDESRYEVGTAVLDTTSTASGKVKIDKNTTTNTITITVTDDIKVEEYFDLALRKFISRVVDENGEAVYTTQELENRIPDPDTTNFRYGPKTTADYDHNKTALPVNVGNKVTYTLRVYNEGNVDAYLSQITDYLSRCLEYVDNNGAEWIREYGDEATEDQPGDRYVSKLTTTGLTVITGASENLSNLVGTTIGEGVLIPAYDKDNDKLSYIDVQITCKVKDPETSGNYKITNIAEITGMRDKKGNVVDIDSTPGNLEPLDGVEPKEGIELPKTEQEWQDYKDTEIVKDDYVPGQEDDDDFEKLIIGEKFDLALRKFITKVNTTSINNRYPELSIDENGNIKYTHDKTPLEVCMGDTVIYTIRVYNEGKVDGYANEITDDVPFGLEFITDNPINQEYGWRVLDENGQETQDVTKAKYIVTDYLSEKQATLTGRNNIIKAFNEDAELNYTDPENRNPDYKEVQIAFKVAYQVKQAGDENKILVNVAQISEDSSDDIDSTPKRNEVYNDKNHEDDIDYENVKVKYFDLSLLKWVTRAIIVENGETTIQESGHTGYENPEPDLKVELKTKDINKVIVKFAYTIRIKNEGEIAGYAKEITDHIPEGLEFKQEDNPDWYVRRDGVVATAQLENELLQPGDTAEVEIILTWVNGEKNLGRKVNVAEISKDYNISNTPDIDSTPDNEVPDEDDIDDAPVLLVIKTGTETDMQYMALIAIVIAILETGIIGIKKFVL